MEFVTQNSRGECANGAGPEHKSPKYAFLRYEPAPETRVEEINGKTVERYIPPIERPDPEMERVVLCGRCVARVVYGEDA